MGSKHPISLKFKHYLNWNSTIYKFNLKNLLKISYQETILLILLKHYFQSLLISKPINYHFNNRLVIIIYYYSKTKSKKYISRNKSKFNLNKQKKIELKISKYEIGKKIFSWKLDRLKKLETILTIIYGKKVKLKLIKLKNPILSSSILVQYLSLNSIRYNINSLWRKILKKFRLANFKKHYNSSPITFNWKDLTVHGYSFLFNQFYTYIIGIRLKISGRFSRRKGASRTKVKNYLIGSFKFNSASSLIDYSFIEKKSKNGTQSIKVFTATIVSY